MSSDYAKSLELLAQVEEQVNGIRIDAIKNRINIQRLYAFGQNWDLLRVALTAAREVAEKAKVASKKQCARHRDYARKASRFRKLRSIQAKTCLSHFRYVTALSNHARALRRYQDTELIALGNLDDYYKDVLVPHADVVESHQRFLDTLNCRFEAVKRNQKLNMVYVRWVRIQAIADLKRHAKSFHLTVRRLKIRKRRADDASRRAGKLQRKMAQRVREYEYLQREVLKVQRVMQAL